MSYTDLEASTAGAAPIELYRFVSGQTHFTYTSAAEPISYQAATYAPAALERANITQSGELNKATLQISAPRDLPLVTGYIALPPNVPTTLTLFRGHRGAADLITYWKGRVTSVSWAGSTATIHCEPIFTALRRAGLRRRFQPLCPHVLYDSGCRAGAASFKFSGTVAEVIDATVRISGVAAPGDGYYTAGYVQYHELARRLILAHSADQLTLAQRATDLAVGDAIDVYAGCDHRFATCRDKFANADNFGGFPDIPGKNPFGGAQLF